MEEWRQHVLNILKDVAANPPTMKELERRVDLIIDYVPEEKKPKAAKPEKKEV